MSLTSRAYGERGRRRAIKQGIDLARLPPGQSPAGPGKWPVLTVGAAPAVAPEDWKLFVYGEVAEETAFTLEDLRPRAIEQVCDIHCVTRWSRFDMRWEGARVRELLSPTPQATHALIHSYGGYSTNLPLEALLDDDVLVAWVADGEPLAWEHGGPVRLLVPQRYFWKSAKYLQAIELLDHDEPEYIPPARARGTTTRAGGWDESGTDEPRPVGVPRAAPPRARRQSTVRTALPATL